MLFYKAKVLRLPPESTGEITEVDKVRDETDSQCYDTFFFFWQKGWLK